MTSTGRGFCGLSRKKLLTILQERCRDLGVQMHFETEIESLDRFADADLMAEDRHGQNHIASARGAYDAPAALQAVLLAKDLLPVGRENDPRNPWLRCADAAIDTGQGGWRPFSKDGP